MDTLVRSDGMPMKRGKICGAVCPLSEVNETRGNVTGETILSCSSDSSEKSAQRSSVLLWDNSTSELKVVTLTLF